MLNVTNLDANVAEKTARQVFAKVPGVFVYDMDGTGNQINIATRGLDPQGGDKQYFTKRPQFYPGRGVWSSNGRSLVFTPGFSI